MSSYFSHRHSQLSRTLNYTFLRTGKAASGSRAFLSPDLLSQPRGTEHEERWLQGQINFSSMFAVMDAKRPKVFVIFLSPFTPLREWKQCLNLPLTQGEGTVQFLWAMGNRRTSGI